MYLSAYNYEIQHTRSEKNAIAEYFSRAPAPLQSADSTSKDVSIVNFLTDDSLPVLMDDVKTATGADRTLQK